MKPTPDGYGRLILPTGVAVYLTPEQASALYDFICWSKRVSYGYGVPPVYESDPVEYVHAMAREAERLVRVGKAFGPGNPVESQRKE